MKLLNCYDRTGRHGSLYAQNKGLNYRSYDEIWTNFSAVKFTKKTKKIWFGVHQGTISDS